MYSHYQSGSTGNSSSVGRSYAAVTATHSGLTWNGTQWVVPSQGVAASVSPQLSTSMTNPELVALYTKYYHKWTARCTELSKIPAAVNEAQWAQYHADNASRAAHYFHQNPTARSAPPTLALPPAPPVPGTPPTLPIKIKKSKVRPKVNVPTTENNNQHHHHHHQSLQEPPTVSLSTSSKHTPSQPPKANDGMKRYVDRCLQACGEHNKQAVLRGVEEVIKNEVKAGTLHTTNWDLKELITVENTTTNSKDNKIVKDGLEWKNQSSDTEDPSNTNANSNKIHQSAGSVGSVLPLSNDSNPYQPTKDDVCDNKPSFMDSSTNNGASYYGPSSGGGGDVDDSSSRGVGGGGGGKRRRNKKAAVLARSTVAGANYYGPCSGDDDDVVIVGGGSGGGRRGSIKSTEGSVESYYGPSIGDDDDVGGGGRRGSIKSTGGSVGSYYGPNNGGSGGGAVYKKSKSQKGNSAVDASYYGPADTPTSEFMQTTKKRKKWGSALSNGVETSGKKSKKSNDNDGNYYGPAAATSNNNDSQIDSTVNFISFTSTVSKNKKLIKLQKKKEKLLKKQVQKTEQANKIQGFNQSERTLSSRADRFSGPGGVQDALQSMQQTVDDREWHKYMGKGIIGGVEKKLTEADYENMTIKGTCTTLEKAFLRLTAPPRAELVRPQPILEQHLENLKAEWWGNDKKYRHDYLWFCSQLKAMRQDCTVQRIQNAFAVDVYETHARIALEESDMNEYNQCQTQLKELYSLLTMKTSGDSQQGLRNFIEFLSYRLIYYVFLAVDGQTKGSGSSDMFKIMLTLTPQQITDERIKHALAIREACCSGILDYHYFFQLRRKCPTKGAAQLLDRIVPSMRHQALLRICQGYRPSTVPVDFVIQELGLESDNNIKNDNFGRNYLLSCGCVLSDDGNQLLTKETTIHESTMEAKKSLI